MASPNLRAALLALYTYKKVPTGYRQAWINHIEALGPECERPQDGEVFQSEKHCLYRLNTWGMLEGCAYITFISRARDITPSWEYACIFHSNKGLNQHELQDDRVQRELVKGKLEIISDRQRDTFNRRIGCPV